MTPKQDARRHLDKAEEYAAAARVVLDLGHVNAACSLAVTAGINAKDAVCLLTVGYTDKADDHTKAVNELRRSGTTGRAMAETLRRLLGSKTKSQYSSSSINAKDAHDAVTRTGRLVDVAKEAFAATA